MPPDLVAAGDRLIQEFPEQIVRPVLRGPEAVEFRLDAEHGEWKNDPKDHEDQSEQHDD